jgi:sodium-independent sulfate anion transporter 11
MMKYILRAVILDFSAVNNVDVTCIQSLMDIRTQLDRRSTPVAVQWHFANIKNRWTKRALSAAGFGSGPLHDASEKTPEKEGSSDGSSDIEKGMEMSVSAQASGISMFESSARPFFHTDLTTALRSVDVYLAIDPST